MRNYLVFCLGLILTVWMSGPVEANKKLQNLGQQALAGVNAYRAQNGLAALQIDRKLTAMAAAHAGDMVKKRFFSHTGSNGSTLGKRARKQRYKFCVLAENLAKGQHSIGEVLAGWMESPGHRANMLNTGVTEFGLVRGEGNLWVMVLGRSGC